MTKRELLKELQALIQNRELVVWIHGKGMAGDYLPSAVNVCMNGPDIQIEVDPKWRFQKVND